MADPSPALLAAIDQEERSFAAHVDRLVELTRLLDATDTGIPTIARVSGVLVQELDAPRLAAVLASALIRLARQEVQDAG